MADNTKIEWADSTANFWIGCTKLSPACDHCYAEADFDLRKHRVQWGPHGDRSYCKTGWEMARKFQRAAARNGGVDPELGRKRRIFVNSLSDFFDNHRSITWRGEAWDLIRSCPDVIFMLLTKRPQNIAKMLPDDWGNGYPNVWLGTTVENQEEANRRIPDLVATPAAVRFLSCEPLLGPVDLRSISTMRWPGAERLNALTGSLRGMFGDYCATRLPSLDWIICGGESGRGARPMHPDWARALRDQCAGAGVSFLFKQWGEWAPMDAARIVEDVPICDRRGTVRDWMSRYVVFANDEGAARVRGHSFTGHSTDLVYLVGKKTAGRLLDGVEHNGVPA